MGCSLMIPLHAILGGATQKKSLMRRAGNIVKPQVVVKIRDGHLKYGVLVIKSL
jgi:hypothetical protein